MSEPDDEDEDEPERWCIKCGEYCWPDQLEWLRQRPARDSGDESATDH